MMHLQTWYVLLQAAMDCGHLEPVGGHLECWLLLIQHDFDSIDRDYYMDTIGG